MRLIPIGANSHNNLTNGARVGPNYPGNSLSGGVANTAYFNLFEPVLVRTYVDKCLIVPSTQSGNIDVGIYRYDTTTNAIYVTSSGSTAVGVANSVQVLSLLTGVWLEPGVDYYAATVFDNAVAQMAIFGSAGVFGTLMHAEAPKRAQFAVGSSFPLASTRPTVNPNTGSNSIRPWSMRFYS